MIDDHIDSVALSTLWQAEPEAERVVHDAVKAVFEAQSEAFPEAWEVSVALTDNAHIQLLNAQFRGQDKPTNVLSFPGPEDGAFLGDIALAFETIEAESKAEGKPFVHHLSHLTIHGLLHLLGYDHETEAEAEEMEAVETAILAAMGIADPYAEA